MRLLSEFYAEFMDRYAHVEDIGKLWHLNTYDTKFGVRQEVSFIGKYITFIQMPANLGLSLLVQQTNVGRVYTQAGFLMQEAMTYLTEDQESVYVSIHGQAFQAFINLRKLSVEQVRTDGTIEGVDRFGIPKDVPLNKIVGVRVSRTT